MAFFIKKSKRQKMLNVKEVGSNYEQCPQGTHVAYCYLLADLGMQEETYQGESKGLVRKVRIAFEVFPQNEDDVYLKQKNGESFAMGKTYTSSLSQKSNLRKHLEAWRGRAFTIEELAGFDLRSIHKKWCMITSTHVKKIDGSGVSASITAITPMMRGLEKPATSISEVNLDLDAFDLDQFKLLGKYFQDLILNSPSCPSDLKNTAEQTQNNDSISDEEIPF